MKNFSCEINEDILTQLNHKKNSLNLKNNDWNDFFSYLLGSSKKTKSSKEIIENTLQKNAFNRYYDSWIQNFIKNLTHFTYEKSAKELSPTIDPISNKSSAIIIGRGPSLREHNHLEKLANSDFKGKIICTDGILQNALKAGVTPDKFPNFYVITIDTNEEIKPFYDNELVAKYGKKIKCLLSTTVPQTTYDAIKKSQLEIFWLHTLFDYNKGKSSFNYISGQMTKNEIHPDGFPAIQTGGNVGTSCWIVSWSILKSNFIGLIGIDHGYSVNTSWEMINKYHQIPENIDKNSSAFKKAYPKIYNPDYDSYCIQDPVFQLYSKALKEFVPKAPKWTKTINATEGGSIFGKGIECTTLSKFLQKYNFS
jgi:hypothetical protein